MVNQRNELNSWASEMDTFFDKFHKNEGEKEVDLDIDDGEKLIQRLKK